MNFPENKHVVAICGSQRDGSYTRLALDRAVAAVEQQGATVDLIDLAEWNLPMYDPDRSDSGDAETLRKRVQSADAILLGTPLYHGSYASPLKTAIDYCGFDEFEGKTVGLLVVAGGGFPTPALEHLQSVAQELNAWVMPERVAIPNASDQFDNGELTDEQLADRIEAFGSALVEYAGVEMYPETSTTCVLPGAD